MALTTQQIADLVGGRLSGPGELDVVGVQGLDEAGPRHIAFITESKYAEAWPRSRAAAVIVGENEVLAEVSGKAVIRVKSVDLAVAQTLEAFAPPPPELPAGIHPSAVVSSTAIIGQGARIGPYCVIGAGAKIGARVSIYSHVTVLDESVIGDDSILWPGVVVRERCVMGSRCIVHPNVVIGADGFGFRPSADGRGLVKVPQIGNVVIGDDVEIGAGTCVDRAKFGSTTIGDMTKIDNLCQIAHNCRIGRCVVIAAGCGIAGSTVLEDGVMLGGNVGLRDHLKVGRGAKIAAYAAVMRDVPAGEVWCGYPAKDLKATFREFAAMKYLPDLVKLMKNKLPKE